MLILVTEKDVQTVLIERHGRLNRHMLFSLPLVEFLTTNSPSRSPRASEDMTKEVEFIQISTRALSKTLEMRGKNTLYVQKYKSCKMQVSAKK